MNGNKHTINTHEQPQEQVQEQSLEDSISSLLSQVSNDSLNFEYKSITSSFKKSAKLFINKKFLDSYNIIKTIIYESIDLKNQNIISEYEFINIWSLYFNLLDIFLNKSIISIPKSEKDSIYQKLFKSNEFWNIFQNQLNQIVDPKLIVLLVLIKLNNNEIDTDELQNLRQQIDLYMVNFTSIYNINDQLAESNHEKLQSFNELLEIYHVFLLSKLNEFEESEYLINSNPYIFDKIEMISKLYQTKKDIEESIKKQKELKAKKIEELRKRKELQQKEDEELKKQKEFEKQQKELIKSQRNHNKKISKSITSSKDTTIFEIIKKRFFKNSQLLQNNQILFIIFTLISLLLFVKNHKILTLNNKIRPILTNIWNKLNTTLKMAFQVTYM
ncbi:hypothetical protein BN7_5631 [Wickerhamomyces ciferrii]|uniref:Uncharacterized protein n=1 Tax=Wickerhamomyces ciferrii (strain ATCC 14091 / BCRC 22168 / CBS 111 / JCM 3599 / NBRC 0793 / NRRL Y-1031 F-60-10) TaxID=1206466 RepID=K0KY67_WICCF|nr:uncharacterized protein BN7_5631 [Wickerhamomyces ciferrii]CCH46043.1 hypothetical protein BN7_5631 [Wickerhamomyces ciferrii]